MRCPFCDQHKDRVVDSRAACDGRVVRRRRECLHCRRRFTTYERVDTIPYMVVKKGGTRQRFDRSKVLEGLLKACEKRPVAPRQLEQIVNEVKGHLMETLDRELTTHEIGRIVMEGLKQLDRVAYLRFASVYLEFSDVSHFMKAIDQFFQTH